MSNVKNKSENIEENNILTKDDLINSLKGLFATTVTRIYINSLDKEISFREITVHELKTLTRIMAANQNRKDIIYDAQCALINLACLDQSFNIYNCSDFDRLKILMSIYLTNMFANEVKFVCDECGKENKYKVNFENALNKLDDIQLVSKEFEYENKNFKYKFVTEFPSVSHVSAFHKSYCQKHAGHPRKHVEANDSMQNMEYINLFIKTILITNKSTNVITNIDFSLYKVGDQEDIMALFPQDVLYTLNGVLVFITENFITPLNSSFDKHKCVFCGSEHEKGDVNNSESFF